MASSMRRRIKFETEKINLERFEPHKWIFGSTVEPEVTPRSKDDNQTQPNNSLDLLSVARYAGFGSLGGSDPGVTLAALAHPGLNSVAASRLVDADIHVDAVLSSRYSIGATQQLVGPEGQERVL
jgi:hypothetical protein